MYVVLQQHYKCKAPAHVCPATVTEVKNRCADVQVDLLRVPTGLFSIAHYFWKPCICSITSSGSETILITWQSQFWEKHFCSSLCSASAFLLFKKTRGVSWKCLLVEGSESQSTAQEPSLTYGTVLPAWQLWQPDFSIGKSGGGGKCHAGLSWSLQARCHAGLVQACALTASWGLEMTCVNAQGLAIMVYHHFLGIVCYSC